jgi:hypothetical protein
VDDDGEPGSQLAVAKAKLRQIDGVDAPFLTASGSISGEESGFISRKQGHFDNYELIEPEEDPDDPLRVAVTGVRDLNGVVGSVTMASPAIDERFRKKKTTAGLYLGQGLWVNPLSMSDSFSHQGYSYDGNTVTWQYSLSETENGIGRIFSKKHRAVYGNDLLNAWTPQSGTIYRRVLTAPSLVKQRHGGMTLAVPVLGITAMVDYAGAPALQPGIKLIDVDHQAGVTDATYLVPVTAVVGSYPRGWQFPALCGVGNNTIYMVCVSNFMYANPYDADQAPVAVVMCSTNGGSTWSGVDISADWFDGMPPPISEKPGRSPSALDLSSPLQRSLNLSMETCMLTPLGGGRLAVSYMYALADDTSPHTTYSNEYAGRTIVMSGTTVISVVDGPAIRAAVYLGDDVVICWRSAGFPGVDHDITFARSTDNGETWSGLTPTGLPASMKNQHFGGLTLTEPRADSERQGLVVMPAYDDGAYNVYASRDSGNTWKKTRRITKTDTFYRVDSMLATDGGNNFGAIRYYGTVDAVAPYHPAIDTF